MSAPENPPPFPLNIKSDNGEHWHSEGGMSLRDWFAGQALAGGLIQHHGYPLHKDHVAQSAYDLADAMLTERSKA